MDVEKMLLTGLNVDTSCPHPTCLSILTCKDLPVYTEQDEIAAQEPKQNGGASIFYAPKDDVNAYLKEKFKMNLSDFMRTYTSRIVESGLDFPIYAPLFVCVFRKENNIELLKQQFEEHQALVVSYQYSSQKAIPNLHDSSIYILTLIECEFSLGKYRVAPTAMYHVGEEYNFLIKMSAQNDITVLYEKK